MGSLSAAVKRTPSRVGVTALLGALAGAALRPYLSPEHVFNGFVQET